MIMQRLERMHREARGAGWATAADMEEDPFNALKEQYQEAERRAKSAKDWERYQTAFAKALPEFTRGIIDANATFKSGDVVGGTAAIMDICATARKTTTSLRHRIPYDARAFVNHNRVEEIRDGRSCETGLYSSTTGRDG